MRAALADRQRAHLQAFECGRLVGTTVADRVEELERDVAGLQARLATLDAPAQMRHH